MHYCSASMTITCLLCPTPFLQVLLELQGQSDADFDEMDEGTQVARIQVNS